MVDLDAATRARALTALLEAEAANMRARMDGLAASQTIADASAELRELLGMNEKEVCDEAPF